MLYWLMIWYKRWTQSRACYSALISSTSHSVGVGSGVRLSGINIAVTPSSCSDTSWWVTQHHPETWIIMIMTGSLYFLPNSSIPSRRPSSWGHLCGRPREHGARRVREGLHPWREYPGHWWVLLWWQRIWSLYKCSNQRKKPEGIHQEPNWCAIPCRHRGTLYTNLNFVLGLSWILWGLFQGVPIEEKYTGDGQLIIDLSQVGVKASQVKWLSVWCTVFERSFGHVEF